MPSVENYSETQDIKYKSRLKSSTSILNIIEILNKVVSVDHMLDILLTHMRQITNAEAGSVLLKENNALKFVISQNEFLEKRERNVSKFNYNSFSIPINTKSISGYVAATGEVLMIDDVYYLEYEDPFSFARAFDDKYNYRTKSVLVLPIIVENETQGIIQLINARKDDKIISFTEQQKESLIEIMSYVSTLFSRVTSIENNILRLVKIARLKDPYETKSHVTRVGAYSAEIYSHLSRKRSYNFEEAQFYKANLRLASMLHDIGKVAIPDMVFKKAEVLTLEEKKIVKQHTNLGASFFQDSITDLDKMAYDIVLYHHEKWDGTGYPLGIKGKDIPLPARIVSITDVYDALISRKSQKGKWNEDKVLRYLQELSGKHFDPEIVDVFFSIYDIIRAIRERYPNEEENI